MATPATITLGGKTVPVPTSVQPFVDSPVNVMVPINGAAIVQISAYADSVGDKNAPRIMSWDLLPTSNSSWTHTIPTLKALEGTQTTVTMGSNWASVYITSTSITVHQVRIEWVGKASTDLWKVEIEYSHS